MTPDFDPSIDHYKVLGVKPEANAEEIKKAYRRLAKQYHPDSTGGDKAKEARFKEVGQAYDVLGDSKKRAQYDAFRSGAFGRGASGGFPGAGFPGGGQGFGGANVFDLGDLFSQMFQGGGQARGGNGGNANVRFHQGGPEGFGDAFGPGFGEVPFQGRPRARRRTQAPPAERKVKLSDGSTGTQRGNDVHADVRIGVDQAILGTVADVATLTGTGKVKIPPGTSSGMKLRLKGKGAPGKEGEHGDHYATVHIDVPKQIDEEAKKLLVQLMQRIKR
ncbi:MAG TPA: DnaJ domain-containing protein [Haliangium sp.]|nr:DnaJ domain-containing protein [Haliangium sp.]